MILRFEHRSTVILGDKLLKKRECIISLWRNKLMNAETLRVCAKINSAV
jgi:hypothetical protein